MEIRNHRGALTHCPTCGEEYERDTQGVLRCFCNHIMSEAEAAALSDTDDPPRPRIEGKQLPTRKRASDRT
jgi:endogenous inhibitor of DNA gyrase (YacG/DUF329 family)